MNVKSNVIPSAPVVKAEILAAKLTTGMNPTQKLLAPKRIGTNAAIMKINDRGPK